jgi:hypothetical protein
VLALCKDAETKNWLVHSNGLIWKSRNEFKRSKTQEKSLLFMQGIIDQFRNQGVSMKNKGEYYCSLNFPFKYLLQKELSEMYQSLGMFMSAYELLQDVELNEDAIKCLYMGGRQTDAIKKADALLEKY